MGQFQLWRNSQEKAQNGPMPSSFKTYIWECIQQAPHSWRKGAVIMTVGISIALVVGLFVGWHLNAFPTAIFLAGTAAISAFDVFAILPFQLWKADQKKIAALESALKPKIVLSFSQNDTGCYRPNTPTRNPHAPLETILSTWFRIKVRVVGIEPQTGCKGRLVSIKRAGTEFLAGETPLLPFAPHDGADSLSKTIYPNVPEFVDLLTLIPNEVLLVLRGHISPGVQWGDLFSLSSDYILRIVVVSDHLTSEPIDLLFRWTLDPVTSRIEQQA